MSGTKNLYDNGKFNIAHIEELANVNHDDGQEMDDQMLTEREQRTTLRAIDIRVAGLLGVMFCVSLMDRTNLGAAAIAG